MAEIQKRTDYKISVVIGTFNRTESVQSLLSQLLELSGIISLEVLVFDQSTEENYKTNTTRFPKNHNFHLFRLEKPNTCQYLNMGWQKASSEVVLYLDDDVTITPKTLSSHFDQYNNKNIMGVAGRVLNDGEELSTDPHVGKAFFAGAVMTKNFSYNKPTTADFPYGCNMSFRREILKQLNGFDQLLKPPIYAYNEVDLGLRITHRWPGSLAFEPEALVYHHRVPQGGTRSYDSKTTQKSINFNYGYILGKNFPIWQNALCCLRRLPYQIIKEPAKIKDILEGFWYAKKMARVLL